MVRRRGGRDPLGEGPHEDGVLGAAPGGDDLGHAVPAALGGGHLGGVGGERGDEVVGGEVASELVERGFGEAVVVPLLAGGLRRRLGQEEVVEEQGQQRLVDLSPGRSRPARVVGLGAAGDGHDGGVDEGVGRPGVIGDRRASAPAITTVRLAMPPRLSGSPRSLAGVGAEEQDVEQADERGALAAGGDVGAAEVGDDREAGRVRRSRPGGRSGACRPTRPSASTQWKTVWPWATTSAASGWRRTARSAAAANSWPTAVSSRQTASIVVALGGSAARSAAGQLGGVRRRLVPERREPQHVAVEFEIGGGRVDPVHRRPRHEPDDDHDHAPSGSGLTAAL